MAAQDGDDGLYHSIEIDWCRCPLLEAAPGKVSGVRITKDTRLPAQATVEKGDYGVDARFVEAILTSAGDHWAEAPGKNLAIPELVAPAPPPIDRSGLPGRSKPPGGCGARPRRGRVDVAPRRWQEPGGHGRALRPGTR